MMQTDSLPHQSSAEAGRTILFCWLLPVAWAMVSFGSYLNPGDEYAFYAITSLIGIWWYLLFQSSSIQSLFFPIATITCGALLLVPIGYLMDRLRISVRQWGIVLGGAASFALLKSLLSFPSLERAIAKNGSIAAYVFMSLGVGILVATTGTIVVAGGKRIAHFGSGAGK